MNYQLSETCCWQGFSIFFWPVSDELKNWSVLSSYHALRLEHIHEQDDWGWGGHGGRESGSFPKQIFFLIKACESGLSAQMERGPLSDEQCDTADTKQKAMQGKSWPTFFPTHKSPKNVGAFFSPKQQNKSTLRLLCLNSTLTPQISELSRLTTKKLVL